MPKATKHLSQTSATIVALGEVVEIITQYWDRSTAVPERLVAGEHIDEGDLRVRRWAMTDDDLVPPTFNRWFQSGDVLLHSRNIKKIARPDFQGITGEKLFIIRSKDESVLLQELLPFILQSAAFQEYAESRWAGSTNKFLNKRPLEEFEFTLPPIEEQRRMASSLVACHALFSRYRDAVSTAEQVRDAMLIRLIGTSGLRPLDAVRDKWCYLPLGERYEVALGKMLSPKARLGDEQVPYLRNSNVQWGRFDLSDVATMSIPTSERHRFLLKPGDVLACEGRHVGKSAIWNGEIPGACYQKALHRLRPLDPERDLPGFLQHCLRVYSLTGCLVEATAVTTIPHLPAERFREIVFPFPPRRVQEAVCAQVAKWDAGVDGIENRSSQIAAMAGELVRTLIP